MAGIRVGNGDNGARLPLLPIAVDLLPYLRIQGASIRASLALL